MLTVPFDTRPLTEPVDGSAVRSSVRRMRPHYPVDLYPGGQWRAMVVPLILLLSSVGVLGWGFLWLADGHVAAIGGWIALVWVLIPGAVAIAIAVARHRLGLRWYRLQAFADANSGSCRLCEGPGRQGVAARPGSRFRGLRGAPPEGALPMVDVDRHPGIADIRGLRAGAVGHRHHRGDR